MQRTRTPPLSHFRETAPPPPVFEFELTATERADLCKWKNGLYATLIRALPACGRGQTPQQVVLAAFDRYADRCIWSPARRESLRRVFEAAVVDTITASEYLSIGYSRISQGGLTSDIETTVRQAAATAADYRERHTGHADLGKRTN